MPRDTSKYIQSKAEAEYRLDRGERTFKIEGEPSGLHVALYKFFRKRDKDVSLNKDDTGVWVRRRS